MPVMAKRKPPTVSIYLRLRKAVKEAIEELAEENHRPFPMEVDLALQKWAEQHGKLPPSNGSKKDSAD
jgi:hypothetical protein